MKNQKNIKASLFAHGNLFAEKPDWYKSILFYSLKCCPLKGAALKQEDNSQAFYFLYMIKSLDVAMINILPHLLKPYAFISKPSNTIRQF